ncbi:MAG TPA: ABC transporter ATP-binding protein [Lentisphaeria bacterium]|jgi:sodium transport system ATP-binding protein|nr:ABC transporter ATP-binding protein [Lentisphaeria bacterium]
MTPGIEAVSLRKDYHGHQAVDGIDLVVPMGSIVGLLGPNGAGKTTTLRMLAGILRAASGDIRICGLPVEKHPMAIKRRIGFLSGDTQLYERLTVREILRFFGRLHEMERAELESRIEQLVDTFDMTPFADRRIGNLSAGQTQRANIARTLVHDPDVLILDEATASLDIISSQFIMQSLKQIRDNGKAILFSTHIMSEAEYLCDQISLIHQGHIIAQGTTDEIISQGGADNLTDAFLQLMAAGENQ